MISRNQNTMYNYIKDNINKKCLTDIIIYLIQYHDIEDISLILCFPLKLYIQNHFEQFTSNFKKKSVFYEEKWPKMEKK